MHIRFEEGPGKLSELFNSEINTPGQVIVFWTDLVDFVQIFCHSIAWLEADPRC